MDDTTQAQRPLTFGEKAVGLTFNPSGSDVVQEIKEKAAAFIDLCNEIRNLTTSKEIGRMMFIAITETQTAQMWAVKAVTWKE